MSRTPLISLGEPIKTNSIYVIGAFVGWLLQGCAQTTLYERFEKAPVEQKCGLIEKAVNETYDYVKTGKQGWWFEGACARSFASAQGKLAIRIYHLRDGKRVSGKENETCQWQGMVPYSAEIGKVTKGYVVTALFDEGMSYELGVENVWEEEQGNVLISGCGLVRGKIINGVKEWFVKRDVIDD